MTKLFLSFFITFFSSNTFGYVNFITQNTFHVEGTIDSNLKSRNNLFFGAESFRFGAVFHYNRPYSHHREMIYGAGVQMGGRWKVGLDAGLLERSVFGLRGTGFAGALVISYYVTSGWHFAIPIFYKSIDDGELSKRWEANLLPYIGYDFELF